MSQVQINKIKELFACETEYCRANVGALVREAIAALGLQSVLSLYQQWRILSRKLNNKSKLTCLADRNHRLLLIKYLSNEATNQYKSSYFNRAKINLEYIKVLDQIGPYNFAAVITIVNKLKLIKKYYVEEPSQLEAQNHIKLKIEDILATCTSKKRIQNSNFHKFIKIVQFQDSQQLINQFSKILRLAWTKEKFNKKQNQNSVSVVPISNNQVIAEILMGKPTQKQTLVDSLESDLKLIDFFSQDFEEEKSLEAGFEL